MLHGVGPVAAGIWGAVIPVGAGGIPVGAGSRRRTIVVSRWEWWWKSISWDRHAAITRHRRHWSPRWWGQARRWHLLSRIHCHTTALGWCCCFLSPPLCHLLVTFHFRALKLLFRLRMLKLDPLGFYRNWRWALCRPLFLHNPFQTLHSFGDLVRHGCKIYWISFKDLGQVSIHRGNQAATLAGDFTGFSFFASCSQLLCCPLQIGQGFYQTIDAIPDVKEVDILGVQLFKKLPVRVLNIISSIFGLFVAILDHITQFSQSSGPAYWDLIQYHHWSTANDQSDLKTLKLHASANPIASGQSASSQYSLPVKWTFVASGPTTSLWSTLTFPLDLLHPPKSWKFPWSPPHQGIRLRLSCRQFNGHCCHHFGWLSQLRSTSLCNRWNWASRFGYRFLFNFIRWWNLRLFHNGCVLWLLFRHQRV